MEDDHDNEEEEVPITEEDEGVEEQVDKFFAELDIDHERKKRRLLKNDGPKVSRHFIIIIIIHTVIMCLELSS